MGCFLEERGKNEKERESIRNPYDNDIPLVIKKKKESTYVISPKGFTEKEYWFLFRFQTQTTGNVSYPQKSYILSVFFTLSVWPEHNYELREGLMCFPPFSVWVQHHTQEYDWRDNCSLVSEDYSLNQSIISDGDLVLHKMDSIDVSSVPRSWVLRSK